MSVDDNISWVRRRSSISVSRLFSLNSNREEVEDLHPAVKNEEKRKYVDNQASAFRKYTFSDIWSLSKCEVNVEKYSNILILQSYQWRRWHYYNDDQIKILSTLDLQWNGEKQINREFGEVQEVLLLEDVQGHHGQTELAGDEAGLGLEQTLHWQTHDTETEDIILQCWTQEEEVKLSICDGE